MKSPMLAIVRSAFAIWITATALHQFSRVRPYTRRLDFQGLLLPMWTFFAPYPGSSDAELLYRTFTPEGEHTAWRHLPIYERRRRSHFLLHTNRRLEKTVFDATAELTQLVRKYDDERRILGSPAYLTLLSIVLALAKPDGPATELQFMIMQSAGPSADAEHLRPVLASARHAISSTHRSRRGWSPPT